MVDQVSADREALAWFVERGRRHVDSLRGIALELDRRRASTVSALGPGGPPSSAAADLGELLDEATINNGFVGLVHDALAAFDPDQDPMATVSAATVDWVLGNGGLLVTGTDLSPSVDRIVARRLAAAGTDDSLLEAAAAFAEATGTIDAGNDLHMTNGELNAVHGDFKALGADELEHVTANLTDQQLERLFHNVHSSGFWSNDWDDRERTEFYDTLSPLSIELKAHLGRHSPYLEAEAEARRATVGSAGAAALEELIRAEGYREELNFEERAAVLWQVANYAEPVSIRNLERLVAHDWFHDFDLADTQRTAKMIAFLAQYPDGDQVVVANTLDLFLAPDAPYTLDWDQDGSAYGSAGGDEFHFNRDYLPDGNGPVDNSVNRTEHMVTHTVAHEVNHLVNGDSVAETFEYFMGEYRAYYVGHLAQHGSAPSRADVEARVQYLLTATGGAYRRIAAAVDDTEEGPKIADFVTDVVGRPITTVDVAAELKTGVSDPDVLAPTPVSVDGGPNNLDNSSVPRDGS